MQEEEMGVSGFVCFFDLPEKSAFGTIKKTGAITPVVSNKIETQ